MAPPQPKSGIFVGLNKGHIVTRKELPLRPLSRKGGIREYQVKTYISTSAELLDHGRLPNLEIGSDHKQTGGGDSSLKSSSSPNRKYSGLSNQWFSPGLDSALIVH